MALTSLTLSQSNQTRSSLQRTLLRGEELEQRCVPAVYRWAAPGNMLGWADWDQKANWQLQALINDSLRWVDADRIPDQRDSVIFTGEATNRSCVVSTEGGKAVKSLSIVDGWVGFLELDVPLTVTERVQMDTGKINGNSRLVLYLFSALR
jgi:hypothetical protein